MSQSTTTDGSQHPFSQNETVDPNMHLRYPDRLEFAYTPSEESFVACSLDVPLTQMSEAVVAQSLSVSATPSPVSPQEQERDKQEKVKKDIARMNEEFTKHKYEAFVHKNMHLMFKVYPFDLKWYAQIYQILFHFLAAPLTACIWQ